MQKELRPALVDELVDKFDALVILARRKPVIDRLGFIQRDMHADSGVHLALRNWVAFQNSVLGVAPGAFRAMVAGHASRVVLNSVMLLVDAHVGQEPSLALIMHHRF